MSALISLIHFVHIVLNSTFCLNKDHDYPVDHVLYLFSDVLSKIPLVLISQDLADRKLALGRSVGKNTSPERIQENSILLNYLLLQ